MKTYKKTTSNFRVVKEKTDFPAVKVTCSDDSQKFIRQFFTDIDIFESFYLLLLNKANITEGYVKISQGGYCRNCS